MYFEQFLYKITLSEEVSNFGIVESKCNSLYTASQYSSCDYIQTHRMSKESKQPDLKILCNTFRVSRKIDEGAFGKIYQAFDLKKKNLPGPHVAVKFQSMRAQNIQLIYECKMYGLFLGDLQYSQKGIPKVYCCGVEGQYNFLVMDLMGPSLESLLARFKNFSLKTTLLLLDQMISRIEYVHSRQIIHRDIKPDNFCMGLRENLNKLYIIDFGLAKKYTKEGRHIPFRQGKSLTGTARYASVNTHQGYQQSRRDDLEGIAYVSIYLFKGVLPWQGLKGNTKTEKYKRIKEKKLKTSIEDICKGCPQPFFKFLSMIRQLKFDEKPNYRAMQNLFRGLAEQQGYKYDFIYDWTMKAPNEKKM